MVWLLAIVAVGGAYLALRIHAENASMAIAIAALTSIAYLVITLTIKFHGARRNTVRRACGLDPEPVYLDEDIMAQTAGWSPWRRRTASLGALVLVSAFSGLIVAFAGARGGIISALLAGIHGWRAREINLRQSTRTAAEVVARRLAQMPPQPEALQDAQVDQEAAAGSTDATVSAGPSLPQRPLPVNSLPSTPASVAELLNRWPERRADLRRLYGRSLAILIGGYTLLVVARTFPAILAAARRGAGLLGALPIGYLLMLLATVWFVRSWHARGKDSSTSWRVEAPLVLLLPMLLAGLAMGWIRSLDRDAGRSADTAERETSRSRHAALSIVIWVWRFFILLYTPAVALAASGSAEMIAESVFRLGVLALLIAHWFWMHWATARTACARPLEFPLRLVMLRVFGSPSFDDLVALVAPWLRLGTIEHLEGSDTIGASAQARVAVEKGRVDTILAKDAAEVAQQLMQTSLVPDDDLRYRRHAFQCTNATWRGAIRTLLDQADAVVMDLSNFSAEHLGCAWELGQILDRVPLRRVTLLINDTTDTALLGRILDTAGRRMPQGSPNFGRSDIQWPAIRISRLASRNKDESYEDWAQRIDLRLDPLRLTGWLVTSASRSRTAGERPAATVALTRPLLNWARQGHAVSVVFLMWALADAAITWLGT